jgi:NhaA family Na+:H+ antiporter
MRDFFKRDSAPGVLLACATLLALAACNSAALPWYRHFVDFDLGAHIFALRLSMPLLLWVNDGLMAIFFFLVGLEIKREILTGELSSARRMVLPLAAALGGMALPAAIYAVINRHDPVAFRGWAIPSATDIAFALGALSLLGSRIPNSLRVFLTAVAILDDLGAILIIAVFYTEDLSGAMLAAAAVCLAALILLNRLGVRKTSPYLVAGFLLWVCVLQSGVHATLAGVATALAIPLEPGNGTGGADGATLVDDLEHAMKPWVNFGILPLFAFANAGLSFAAVAMSSLLHRVTLGIALGLIVGKSVGVFCGAQAALLLRLADAPRDSDATLLFGVACLCGIGFTMSLFIGSLAFGERGDYPNLLKLGVFLGSAAAGVVGAAVLTAGAATRARAAPAK